MANTNGMLNDLINIVIGAAVLGIGLVVALGFLNSVTLRQSLNDTVGTGGSNLAVLAAVVLSLSAIAAFALGALKKGK